MPTKVIDIINALEIVPPFTESEIQIMSDIYLKSNTGMSLEQAIEDVDPLILLQLSHGIEITHTHDLYLCAVIDAIRIPYFDEINWPMESVIPSLHYYNREDRINLDERLSEDEIHTQARAVRNERTQSRLAHQDLEITHLLQQDTINREETLTIIETPEEPWTARLADREPETLSSGLDYIMRESVHKSFMTIKSDNYYVYISNKKNVHILTPSSIERIENFIENNRHVQQHDDMANIVIRFLYRKPA